MDDLGLEYSIFYVARYTGGRKGRVIDAKQHNWSVLSVWILVGEIIKDCIFETFQPMY